MNKKEYIEKAKNTILNRVRFHAPVVYDDKIDKRALFVGGVDISKPVFKFDKTLSKELLKAFELAQNEEEFNLLISLSSLGKIKEEKLKSVKNCILYSPQSSPVSFVEMINKLNINYQSSSNYNLIFRDKYFKINNQILNPKYEDFTLKQDLKIDEILINYQEFILNGNNYLCQLFNGEKKDKKIKIELNIPLKKGYYFFKKLNKCFLIENLLTKEKFYLNFLCKNAKFSFSNVDGLENSPFCCVNVEVLINLNADDNNFVFFNLGGARFNIKSLTQIYRFLKISKSKCCEIFNVKVKTKNTNFDNFFNFNLPKKIWINWLNDEIDLSLEEKYVTLKKLFVVGDEKLSFVNFKDVGLKELGIYNGDYYKKIQIVGGDFKFLQVGKTVFQNINGISLYSLKKSDPIMLCFGE